MAVAYAMRVTRAQLQLLLGHLEPQFGWVILTSVVDVQFRSVVQEPDGWRLDHTFDVAAWEKGRGFGALMEMRWRRRRDQYAVLVTAETPMTLHPEVVAEVGSVPEPVLLERPENAPLSQMALWGEWQNPEAEPDLPSPSRLYWYETRIPRFLDYPWPTPAKHLALEVARYRVRSPAARPARAAGPADFLYRFVGLKEMPGIDEEGQDGETTVIEKEEGV